MHLELKKDMAFSDVFIAATVDELKELRRVIDGAINDKNETTNNSIFSEKPEWNYYTHITKMSYEKK